jgi:murein DD-endopeptidase MepM/ murein hydrolase activator NlpD
MSDQVRSYRGAVQIALAGAAVALLGGCAADSSRFSDFSSPFSNPFSTASRDVDRAPTGAIPDEMPPRSGGIRSGPIQSTPLPAPGDPAVAPGPQRYGAAPMSQPQRVAQGGGTAGNWAAQGGTQITVGYGETASMLAGRYGVPVDALLKVNGFGSQAQVKQGTRLVIPVYSANSAGAPARSVKAQVATLQGKPAAPAKVAAGKAKYVLVKGPHGKIIKMEVAPTGKATAVKGKAGAKTAAVTTAPAQKLTKIQSAKVAKIEAAPVTKVPQTPTKIDPQPTASLPPKAEAVPAAAPEANPEFRWPARGRIIQGFKKGGNDGINISVPEGTAVKAAENGVVAYAGNELKGYGNLVLIRHPNGFVSAYANNGEIEVKRGDNVKRGQTIAKSGQTGNVATPQLHFELRKGSTPVDPTQYLAGL